jgi:electron transport complex protein RnfB
MPSSLVDRIDALLPQTQCTRCGYPACLPYAQAIVRGEADIDQCPPGGAEGIVELASLLGHAPKPLNPANGIEAPPTVALIDEDVCIGCTKCIQACPVDAIVGAAKRMHTIIAAECTGCELCIPPCPVDCISMLVTASQALPRDVVRSRAAHARARYETRNMRLDRNRRERDAHRAETPQATEAAAPPISRNAVLEAIARGKARRSGGSTEADGSSSA